MALTKMEEEKIRSINPSYREISEARFFDNFDLPCPVRVTVRTTKGTLATVVLRRTRHGDVRTEVRIIRALKEYGLPVPAVLCAAFETENHECRAVYSLLPGENLQRLSMGSEVDLTLARDLLVRATIELMSATDFIRKHAVSEIVPRITLVGELEALYAGDNPWLEEKTYRNVIRALRRILPSITTPLTFSNGDYQPGNFLALDGQISGFLDFESPRFSDPLMGFVKFPIYDLYPLSRTDLVRRFLLANGFPDEHFACRLTLGCLKTLKREIPFSGGSKEVSAYRNRIVSLLAKAFEDASARIS